MIEQVLISAFNNEELKNIRKSAINFATKRGYAFLAEDFAQEFVLKTWEKQKNLCMNFFLTDFLRKEIGSTRSELGKLKSKAYFTIKSLDDVYDVSSDNKDNDLKISFANESNINISLRSYNILSMFYDGWKIAEIADIYCISLSRVSQILNDIKKKIKYHELFFSLFDEYKSFKDKSVLEINWIKI